MTSTTLQNDCIGSASYFYTLAMYTYTLPVLAEHLIKKWTLANGVCHGCIYNTAQELVVNDFKGRDHKFSDHTLFCHEQIIMV